MHCPRIQHDAGCPPAAAGIDDDAPLALPSSIPFARQRRAHAWGGAGAT
eukprot:gene29429-40750_t